MWKLVELWQQTGRPLPSAYKAKWSLPAGLWATRPQSPTKKRVTQTHPRPLKVCFPREHTNLLRPFITRFSGPEKPKTSPRKRARKSLAVSEDGGEDCSEGLLSIPLWPSRSRFGTRHASSDRRDSPVSPDDAIASTKNSKPRNKRKLMTEFLNTLPLDLVYEVGASTKACLSIHFP